MENRRQNYRLAIPPELRLSAALRPLGSDTELVGGVVNFSVGGLAVALDAGAALGPAVPCTVRLALPGSPDGVLARASITHQQPSGPQQIFGLRFAPLLDPVANENRERLLWRFSLEEQRRQRRERAGYSGD
jgi:hypothetical protein